MNKRCCAVLFLVFSLGCILTAEAGMDQGFYGKYSLNVYQMSSYNTEYLQVTGSDETTVSGIIGIDWSIGPQARVPLPWEKFYEIPFVAKLTNDGSAFEFSVTIADRKEYRFHFFCAYNEFKPALSGYVEIRPFSKMKPVPDPNSEPTLVKGVLALKPEKPKPFRPDGK